MYHSPPSKLGVGSCWIIGTERFVCYVVNKKVVSKNTYARKCHFFTELVSCNSLNHSVTVPYVICNLIGNFFYLNHLFPFLFYIRCCCCFYFFVHRERGRAGVSGCWQCNTHALHLQSLLCSALNPGSYSHSLPQYTTSHTGSAANLLRMKTCEYLLLFIPEILILLSCVHSSVPARLSLSSTKLQSRNCLTTTGISRTT